MDFFNHLKTCFDTQNKRLSDTYTEIEIEIEETNAQQKSSIRTSHGSLIVQRLRRRVVGVGRRIELRRRVDWRRIHRHRRRRRRHRRVVVIHCVLVRRRRRVQRRRRQRRRY